MARQSRARSEAEGDGRINRPFWGVEWSGSRVGRSSGRRERLQPERTGGLLARLGARGPGHDTPRPGGSSGAARAVGGQSCREGVANKVRRGDKGQGVRLRLRAAWSVVRTQRVHQVLPVCGHVVRQRHQQGDTPHLGQPPHRQLRQAVAPLHLRVDVLHQAGACLVALPGLVRPHVLTPGLHLGGVVPLLLGPRHALGH